MELDSSLFWEGLREERKSSDPNSQFSRLWDEYHTRLRRIREAVAVLPEVISTDSITQLVDDTMTAGACRERLLWRFGGLGDFVWSSLEAGIGRLEGLELAKTEKQLPVAELRHKVELIRMDEPGAKRPPIAKYLLEETETESQRCHSCQRHERAVARNEKPPCQCCERYRRYRRCTPCNVCQAWHARLSAWVKKRADGGEVDRFGERIPIPEEEQKRRNRTAIVKRIFRMDERNEANDRTPT